MSKRMNSRDGHFMPPRLLESQLAALEPPQADERHIVVNIEDIPQKILKILSFTLEENTQ